MGVRQPALGRHLAIVSVTRTRLREGLEIGYVYCRNGNTQSDDRLTL